MALTPELQIVDDDDDDLQRMLFRLVGLSRRTWHRGSACSQSR